MPRDTINPKTTESEFSTDQATYQTFYSFEFKRDDFDSIKLWIQAKAIGGGTAWVRIEVTDGVTPTQSTGMSTASGTYDPIGPETLAISGIADKVWTCNIQGKIVGGSDIFATGGVHQRVS